MSKPRKLCRHCGIHYANRPKGLCWRCWHKPDVNALYQRAHSGGWCNRNLNVNVDFYGGYGLPDRPTIAAPKTAEKLAILAERCEAKRALWHPLDGHRDGQHD